MAEASTAPVATGKVTTFRNKTEIEAVDFKGFEGKNITLKEWKDKTFKNGKEMLDTRLVLENGSEVSMFVPKLSVYRMIQDNPAAGTATEADGEVTMTINVQQFNKEAGTTRMEFVG
jgi:hypothetical protein